MKKSNFQIPKLEIVSEFFLIILILFTIAFSFKWSELNNQNESINILISKTSVIQNNSYQKYVNDLWIDEKMTYALFKKTIEEHPYIKAARVSKHFPEKIHVEIIERNPIAYLNTDPMIFLDSEAYILPNQNYNEYINLPILTSINPNKDLYPIGNKVISKNITKCISLLSAIKNQYGSLYENISEIKMSSNENIEIILSDEPTHIYFGNTNINDRIKHLVEFSKLLKPKSLSNFIYLDMRFDNQIIAKERFI